MRTKLCIGLAMAAGLGIGSPAVAQDADWEYQEDAARSISAAAVRLTADRTVIVQCREGLLAAVLMGMPESAEALELMAGRADGRSDFQTWSPAGTPGAYVSVAPGRSARFLRGGGAYSLRTVEDAQTPFEGEFGLPGQSANLDRVLTACGWATTDDRDGLARADDIISVVNADGQPRRPRRTSRSVTRRPRGPAPQQPSAEPVRAPAERIVSCIVRDMHLRECRADHPASAENPDVVMTVRVNEGRRVYLVDDADAASGEGRVVHVVGSRMAVVD